MSRFTAWLYSRAAFPGVCSAKLGNSRYLSAGTGSAAGETTSRTTGGSSGGAGGRFASCDFSGPPAQHAFARKPSTITGPNIVRIVRLPRTIAELMMMLFSRSQAELGTEEMRGERGEFSGSVL